MMKRLARDIFDVLAVACIFHTMLLYRLGFEGFGSAIDDLSIWVLTWRNLFLDIPLLSGAFLIGIIAMNLPLNRRTQLKTMPVVRYAKYRQAQKREKDNIIHVEPSGNLHVN